MNQTGENRSQYILPHMPLSFPASEIIWKGYFQLNVLQLTVRLQKGEYGDGKRIAQECEQAARSIGNVELLLLSTLTTYSGLKHLSDYNPGIFQIASHFTVYITIP